MTKKMDEIKHRVIYRGGKKTGFHTSLRPAGLNRSGTTSSNTEGLFSEQPLGESAGWERSVFTSFSVGVVKKEKVTQR